MWVLVRERERESAQIGDGVRERASLDRGWSEALIIGRERERESGVGL